LTLQTPTNPGNYAALNSQQKELNILTLCRIGQETVQDILSRFQDVFSILKHHQPPNGTQGSAMMSADKRQKMQDQFRTIRLLFKRLRLLYEKCEHSSEEYIEIESLIPYVGQEKSVNSTSNSEEYQKALAENRELMDVLKEKNLQLKEIIDRIRNIISEINTMMSSRK
jgi:mediator of RNA polymerase II transcription subunit 30